MFQQGLYESLINKLLESKLSELDRTIYFVGEERMSKSEASRLLASYLAGVFHFSLLQGQSTDGVEWQINLANKIIRVLASELNKSDFEDDIIQEGGRILKAVFSKVNSPVADYEKKIAEITPYTGLSQSELFTGSNAGVSLDSELKKEILSSDEVCLLVSFIKWSGVVVLRNELEEFVNRGGKLRVLTTTYMGASDIKAVNFLADLKNTEVKVSYNTKHERLHAKAYLFLRNTGFDTGYIGSSNMSRSALTNGLEWNVRITSQEVRHILDKFRNTFETYWSDSEFQPYDPKLNQEMLSKALKVEKGGQSYVDIAQFDIKPHHYQEEILEKLTVEREVHNRYRNLIVAATGTGKTIISAFDYRRFARIGATSRLLFVAHRKEILQQALYTFRSVLKDPNFGELWVDGMSPTDFSCVFASVTTLANASQELSLRLKSDFYDFIIVDEVHHIAAASYRPILQSFSPQVLLGLTATPERMDGQDILKDFDDTIAAEIRLPEALKRKLLCPFVYFGITDTVDLTQVQWRNGRYIPSELSKVFTNNDARVPNIIRALDRYVNDPYNITALGFCITQEHARFMAEKFVLAGFKADWLSSERATERDDLRRRLIRKDINYLFVVDIFNEGVDIPEIDTVLFLRPTESLTIFLQQLGRGLRLAEGKERLTVLDFVGNARPEYDFERKFAAIIDRRETSILSEVLNDFPHAPLGCSIILEPKAKEVILRNIKEATNFNRNRIIQKVKEHYALNGRINLKDFCKYYEIGIETIFKRGSWNSIMIDAGIRKAPHFKNDDNLVRSVFNKWCSTSSLSYFQFIIKVAESGFKIDLESASEDEKVFALMLYYDFWTKPGLFSSIEEGIKAIAEDPDMSTEILEVMYCLVDRISSKELPIELPVRVPIKVHSRYTREQILAAFGFSTFEKKSSNREGVAYSKENNLELLFITLDKSEGGFSPTTLYADFAVNDRLFHWQSQNSARPDSGKGYDYVRHQEIGRRILLFLRERVKDEYGRSIGYVFLGDANFVSTTGAKPMSVNWELQEPMPSYLWNDAAKMAVG